MSVACWPGRIVTGFVPPTLPGGDPTVLPLNNTFHVPGARFEIVAPEPVSWTVGVGVVMQPGDSCC